MLATDTNPGVWRMMSNVIASLFGQTPSLLLFRHRHGDCVVPCTPADFLLQLVTGNTRLSGAGQEVKTHVNTWTVFLIGIFVGFLFGWYIERIVRALRRISAYAERFR